MNKQRSIDDLTHEERERIVAAWREHSCWGNTPARLSSFCLIAAMLLDFSVDAVVQVLREEGG